MAWQLYQQNDFSGGENLSLQSNLLADNQVQKALNCVITSERLLESRDGKTKANSSASTLGAGAITSVHRYTQEDGDQYIAVQHSTSLYAVSWDGATTITSWSTAKKTSLNVAKLRSVVWKDHLILTNGVDNPFRFNGTTCTDLAGSPPKSNIITVYANRLWLVDAANPNQIRWSGLESYDTWDALDVINVRSADGDVITGLAAMQGGMVVFKKNSAFVLYGTNRDDIRLVGPISEYIGCVGYDAYIHNGLCLGKDNLYRFDLNGLYPLSQTHTRIIQSAGATYKDDAVIQAVPLKQYAVVALKDTDNTVLCVDGRYGGITRWQGLNIGSMSVADDKTDDGSLLIGDATNGMVYRMTGADDDGTAITTRIRTKHWEHGVEREKVWRYILPELEWLSASQYNLTITADTDYDEFAVSQGDTGTVTAAAMLWGTTNWAASNWGSTRFRTREKLWWYVLRGAACSFELSTIQRIRLTSLQVKYKEVGPL